MKPILFHSTAGLIRYLKFASVFALSINFCNANLQVCFFDTGQGNLTVLRSGADAVIIDCGATKLPTGSVLPKYNSQFLGVGPKIQALRTFLGGITKCTTVITHNHRDHDNLYNVMESSLPGTKTKIEAWCANITDTIAVLHDALGANVEIIPIRPDTWTTHVHEVHDKNLIIKVKFATRSVLFTGDASSQLFTAMFSDPRYCNDLMDVDCLVLPHHGSNGAGELLSFYAINPEMCVA